VVASGSSDDSPFPLLRAELRDQVDTAPDLKSPYRLVILMFNEDFGP
jgi:hypothetical protein